ncbi:MAG: type II toxin-antitoxin system VapC family toxin [Nitrospirota bacterium]
MKKVFFDTWGWVAIAHKDDTHHKDVIPFYKTFLLSRGIPITTDYVLAETVTLLRARMDFRDTAVFIDAIFDGVKKDKIMLERIDERRWIKAWELSKKYSHKPYVSFFDFSSFVVMKELNISEALTADKYFEEVGMGFKKLF